MTDSSQQTATDNPWLTGTPPHMVEVEVELDGRIVAATFISGIAGRNESPHWLHDGIQCPPETFPRWRWIRRRPMVRTGAEMIATERVRQTSQCGWTPEHDDGHANGELADVAAYFAATERAHREISDAAGDAHYLALWPDGWNGKDHRRESDRLRQLVVAGALIAAEIDRLLRAERRDVSP